MDYVSAARAVRLRAKLPRLTVVQLKVVLRRLSCRVSGRKQQLIDRVVEKALTSQEYYASVQRYIEESAAYGRRSVPFGSAMNWAQYLVSQINQRRQHRQQGAAAVSFGGGGGAAVALGRPTASTKPPSAAHIKMTADAAEAPSARRDFQQLCADSDPFAAIVHRDLLFFDVGEERHGMEGALSVSYDSRFVVPGSVQELISKEQLEVTFEAYETLCGSGGGSLAAAAAAAPAPLAAQRRHAGTLRCAAPSAARAGCAVRVGRWSCCGASATVASCSVASLAPSLASSSAAASAAPPALYTSTSVSFLLYTVTCYANLAHSLTRSP
jgi:hypothetical protein